MMNNSKLLPLGEFKHEAYYLLKKIIPRQLQIIMRKHIIHWKLSKYGDIWPIDKSSAKPPEDWSGWPEGKKFALVITHDIESAKGVKKCRQLVEIEKSFGFRSSFNFVAEDYEVPAELRHYLTDNGFEVGVHGLHHDKNTFSKKIFYQRADQINRYLKEWGAVGFRAPSMYHNLDMIHDLDVDYDASTFDTDPFEPQPDGMGTIFPVWVQGNSSQKGYVELPYTLPQDFLLFILMKEKNIEIWKKKLNWIAENGGMALFDTHPDYMNFRENILDIEEYPAEYYEQFLNYIKEKYEGHYWNVLPREVAHFWESNFSKKSSITSKYEKEDKKISVSQKKKIWIDLDNSPHVPFFRPIINELKERGYDITITARDCFQVCGLADLLKLDYKKIGKHYGKNKLLKVAGLLIRSHQLTPTILHAKPDLALSHGSRSQVLLSAILNIPSISIGDYEFTQGVVRPTYIFVPELIPDDAISGYKKRLLKYPGIKEDVYVPSFKPDIGILNELGIRKKDILVTIRPPATEAHYHNPESEELFFTVVDLLAHNPDTRIVILPRNEKKQTALIKNTWPEWCATKKIIIPEHAVNGLDLIWYSDFVVSGGGTMNREAAALGVPVYSIFRGKIGAVDHYLSNNGRLTLLESKEDIKTKVKIVRRDKSDNIEQHDRNALNTILKYVIHILEKQ